MTDMIKCGNLSYLLLNHASWWKCEHIACMSVQEHIYLSKVLECFTQNKMVHLEDDLDSYL